MAKQIYLVGGAVRDALMGLPVKERDWVVVGATPEMLLSEGYVTVGKDFPVFLHPVTKEEYALARTERKSGKGYGGFTVYADPSVTLEEDLRRRDLTINAIAQDAEGRMVDPYGGVADISNQCLAHVSPAFQEDPLRLLRLARFQARFTDFSIKPETKALCQGMVAQGELEHLTAERVWQEWKKVFELDAPDVFIATLLELEAWPVLYPELSQPTLDQQRLRQCVAVVEGEQRLAVVGLYLDPKKRQQWLQAMKCPRPLVAYAQLVQSLWQALSAPEIRSAEQLLKAYSRWDIFRRYERFAQACVCVTTLVSADQTKTLESWSRMSAALTKLSVAEVASVATGAEVADAVWAYRLSHLQALWSSEGL